MPFREGLAITGMACVFPGSPTPDSFWARILAAAPAPQASLAPRWGIARERILGAVGEADRTYLDRAFALSPDAFVADDADPQVALGRHVVRGALASARVAPDRAATALVVGTSWTAPSYFRDDAAVTAGGRALAASPYTAERQLALLASAADLGGPRFAIDTACASSLYAIEAAARTMASGQAEAAIVVGLNALLTPFLYVGFSKLRALSPEGRIVPFGVEASGIVPGEGAGAILLEPLERARAAGRDILAVVRGVGLSSDGAERSVFAPGERGQRVAYERAYAVLDPSDVDYVEAHGTATNVGDDTEIETLEAFFGARRERPLPIGSVKALIGHTLASAGMASVIKGVLMLRAGVVPPHVRVTPHGRLEGTRLALPFVPRALAVDGRAARIGISAFGFGGSNAHLVLDGPPRDAPRLVAMPAAISPRRTLAVVDAHVALGATAGLVAVGEAAHGRRAHDHRTLPDEHALDAHGLRMGPNLLRRLDPLQLLLAAAVRDRLVGLGASVDPERTAVVVVSNLGGDTSLRLSRRDLFAHGGGGELHVETIASSLPSMASGYAAYHLDLRGFHETVAGDGGALFTVLRSAPSWLDGACDLLVLGAARLLKSRLEWPAPERTVDEGEGLGVLLLADPERARARGWPIRALVSTEPVGGERARWAVSREGDGDLARIFGRLGEATGLAALAAALTSDESRSGIDVDDGATPWRLVVERRAPFDEPRRAPATLPTTVTLARPLPQATATPPRELTHQAAMLLDSLRASEAAARGVFAAQRDALALLSRTAPAPALADADAEEILEDVTVDAGRASAVLVVREDDPYFFDHPLDHVPGILLVAGVEALAKRAQGGGVVTRMTLQFRRFCEKDAAARIALARESDGAWRGSIAQRREDVATVEVRALRAPAAGVAPSTTGAPTRVDAALVHKRRAENVLVGPLEARANGSYVCRMHVPPRGHFLLSGGPYASAVYLIEAARQVVMLGAHTIVGVPLGAPMNLLKVAVELERPVPAGGSLEARLVLGQKHDLGGMVLADVAVEIGGFGVVRVKAQVVDETTYIAQRRKETP